MSGYSDSIRKAVEAKKELETQILECVRMHEMMFGTTISCISINRIETSNGNSLVNKVEVTVEI